MGQNAKHWILRKPMKTLLAVTTYNQLKYTKQAESSIPNIEGMDIVFIDDASTDNTIEYLKSKKREIITKTNGQGLTHSWNIAYQKFKNELYDGLIISNNDVLFNYTLKNVVNGLSKYEIVVPLTSRRGSGSSEARQDIKNYYPNFNNQDDPVKHKQELSKLTINDFKVITWMHGFCFGINRNIIKCQIDEEHLFKPTNINCHQEGEFYPRIIQRGYKSRVCLSSFIFHYTSKSLPYKGEINGIDSRNVFEFNREIKNE